MLSVTYFLQQLQQLEHHQAEIELHPVDHGYAVIALRCITCKKRVLRYITREVADHPLNWDAQIDILKPQLQFLPCRKLPRPW